jgi:two-component system OmpR family response regulator
MRILLVEDDKNFGYVLKGELADPGYEIDLAQDGVEAVMKFVDGNYDFVLLDIKMPKLDGINALRIIKKLNPGVPAITYSGNAGSGEMAESVKAGAIRCLTKPFEISQLKDELRKYQARHSGA